MFNLDLAWTINNVRLRSPGNSFWQENRTCHLASQKIVALSPSIYSTRHARDFLGLLSKQAKANQSLMFVERYDHIFPCMYGCSNCHVCMSFLPLEALAPSQRSHSD